MRNFLNRHDSLYIAGWVLCIASAALYGIWSDQANNSQSLESLFLLHYATAVFYFISVLVAGKLRKGREGWRHLVLLSVLLLISAYALNRDMNIFHTSVAWLQAALIATCAMLMLSSLHFEWPRPVVLGMLLLLGVGLTVQAYLVLYLLPVSPYAILGVLALGIGVHAFAPLLLLIFSVRPLRRLAAQWPGSMRMFWVGVGVAIVVAAGFSTLLSRRASALNDAYHAATAKQADANWPAWVQCLQTLPPDAVSRKLLRSNWLYNSASDNWVNSWGIGGGTGSWGEERLHDPLIAIANLFAPTLAPDTREQQQMLAAMEAGQHKMEERLWSDDHLKTTRIQTTAQVWPSMRLSYAESIFTVSNPSRSRNWRAEAIYTFQLPEGALVTSLSLWVNGKEEKSILTTRGKATEAYTKIVGVEVRDPSVVHWQEGNRVSVRVFPVLDGESRVFKIGITAPLPVVGNRLVFQSFDFSGPSAAGGTEQISIQLMEPVQSEVQTVALQKQPGRPWYSYEGQYRGGWQLSLPMAEVRLRAFCHNGQQYQLRPWQPRLAPTTFSAVYADVNRAWTQQEWQQLRKLCAGRTLWVYQQRWRQVNDANEAELFKDLHQQQFSLFPFFKLPDAGVLVVSKTAAHTPALKQMQESSAYQAMKTRAVATVQPSLYLLSDAPDLYLRSLRELRQFKYDHGSLQRLAELLQAGLYAADEENDGRIVLHDAQLMIEKGPCTDAEQAPDHLMRLYYYNQLMRQGGSALLADEDAVDASWLAMAEQAHMVSPVSSLLVLETQADYERFNLKKDQQGLDNAKLQSTGAVPEPHEWAMIILLALILVGYYRMRICAH